MTTPLRCGVAALVAVVLLWVPASLRVHQPLVAAHAIGALSKISKSAVLPHDPITPLPFVQSPRTSFHVAAAASALPVVVDVVRPSDRAREGLGLRAPPKSTL